MPPPQLVAEVISPGQQNRERDLVRKRDQYAARGIPESWLLDPESETITVLQLQAETYVEIGTFHGDDSLASPTLPTLKLTAAQIFQAD
jgi:Uma2 family endonuclease